MTTSTLLLETSGRKRCRSMILIPKLPLVTSFLLGLITVILSHASTATVKAFVLANTNANDRSTGTHGGLQQPSWLMLRNQQLHPHYLLEQHHHHQHPLLTTATTTTASRDFYRGFTSTCHQMGHDAHLRLFSTSCATLAPHPLMFHNDNDYNINDDDLFLNVPTNDHGELDFDWLSSPSRLLSLVSHSETDSTSHDDSTTATATATTTTTAQQQQHHQEQPDPVLASWADRYASVEALRRQFGGNHNRLWGDLQASTARRLYKTLLPRALLELSHMAGGRHLPPQDLAPLAYQARVAAKLYARERCTVPARIAATLFDGFRQWMKYGKFQAHGMTYDQLWEKYAEKIVHETESEHDLVKPSSASSSSSSRYYHHDQEDEDDDDMEDEDCDIDATNEDISELICRKILERACVSNDAVDAFVLAHQDLADETLLQPDQRRLLERIRNQLEEDMYRLLVPDDNARAMFAQVHTSSSADSTTADAPARNNKSNKSFKSRLGKRLAKQRRFWKLRRQQKLLAKQKAAAAKETALNQPQNNNNKSAWSYRTKMFPLGNDTVNDEDELKP